MVYGAIDLHSRQCQIRIVDDEGRVVRETRVPTSREGLVRTFAGRGPMRILLEAGTDSEWVAQTLEAVGHTVVVADPNYAPMYGETRRRVKTDRRDAAALAKPIGAAGIARRIAARRRSAGCSSGCGCGGSWSRCGAA